jgi:hypothetical protein
MNTKEHAAAIRPANVIDLSERRAAIAKAKEQKLIAAIVASAKKNPYYD